MQHVRTPPTQEETTGQPSNIASPTVLDEFSMVEADTKTFEKENRELVSRYREQIGNRRVELFAEIAAIYPRRFDDGPWGLVADPGYPHLPAPSKKASSASA